MKDAPVFRGTDGQWYDNIVRSAHKASRAVYNAVSPRLASARDALYGMNTSVTEAVSPYMGQYAKYGKYVLPVAATAAGLGLVGRVWSRLRASSRKAQEAAAHQRMVASRAAGRRRSRR